MLPDTALDQLTAEDLRLLLNGVGDIHVGTLISYTSFNDESNESSDKLLKFKRWLWSVVEKMSNLERQDLVGFNLFDSANARVLIINHSSPPLRSTSGQDRQPCQPPRKVSNQCHRLRSDRRTMPISRRQTPASPGCTSRSTRARPFSDTSCYWR